MKYMIQLDSLRAFAVFAVMYQHFYSDKMPTIFNRPLYWGSVGVELFFVLSGFLITSILLKYKDGIDIGNDTTANCLKRFYYRRTLRIFPIYYLLLLLALVLSVKGMRETIYWHLCYLSNVYIVKIGQFPQTNFTHFWSLAVEEQFYLFWPWIILLTPRRHILAPIVAMISAGPLYRFFCLYIIGAFKFTTDILTFGSLDLLGMGALLALLKSETLPYAKYKKSISRLCLIAGSPLALTLFVLKAYAITPPVIILYRLFEGSFFLWLINKASDGMTGTAGKILEWKGLVYLGKISYGIYLYHNFAPLITKYIYNSFNITGIGDQLDFSFCVMLSISLAIFSWHLIEQPIQNFKIYLDNKPMRVASKLTNLQAVND